MRSRSSNTSKRKSFGKSTTLPNRASRGLYHGRTVGFGNNVSFSERHTRRKFKPNVQDVRLWSQVRLLPHLSLSRSRSPSLNICRSSADSCRFSLSLSPPPLP